MNRFRWPGLWRTLATVPWAFPKQLKVLAIRDNIMEPLVLSLDCSCPVAQLDSCLDAPPRPRWALLLHLWGNYRLPWAADGFRHFAYPVESLGFPLLCNDRLWLFLKPHLPVSQQLDLEQALRYDKLWEKLRARWYLGTTANKVTGDWRMHLCYQTPELFLYVDVFLTNPILLAWGIKPQT